VNDSLIADYLRDLLDELADVASFTIEGRQSFEMDAKTHKAVIRSYEVIGEIAKRLPQSARDGAPDVDWRKLIGFRDFLAHNYDKIVLRTVWDAVEDLPNLKAAVEAMLATLDAAEDEDKSEE